MRQSTRLSALLAAALIAFPLMGAGRPAGAAESGPAKPPREAPCAVCSVREGAGAEPVRATTTYDGKIYYFCQETCRDEFLEDPKKWIQGAAAPPPASARPNKAAKPGAAAVPT